LPWSHDHPGASLFPSWVIWKSVPQEFQFV